MFVEGEDQFSICGPSGIELQIAFLKLTGEFHVLLLNESDLALKLIDIGRRSESGFAPYGPPLNAHCTTLAGPATVRISNAASKLNS